MHRTVFPLEGCVCVCVFFFLLSVNVCNLIRKTAVLLLAIIYHVEKLGSLYKQRVRI